VVSKLAPRQTQRQTETPERAMEVRSCAKPGRVATHRGPARRVPAATGVSGLWISVADVSLPYNQLAPRGTRRGPAHPHPALPRAAFASIPGMRHPVIGTWVSFRGPLQTPREGWMHFLHGWMNIAGR
jgi:hypothetical protein